MSTPEPTNRIEDETLVYSGKVIVQNVPYEDYLSGKYGEHTEWIFGDVIEMSPVSARHTLLTVYLITLFKAYLEKTGGGTVFMDPMVMRAADNLPARQPDIQVILPERADIIKPNQVAGPANLVVEIVSPGSVQRDRGEKFREYEQGGVDEYWIIDPQREEALFYVRDDGGLYRAQPFAEGIYTSTVLPRLQVTVTTLWEETLPTITQIMQSVDAMLA